MVTKTLTSQRSRVGNPRNVKKSAKHSALAAQINTLETILFFHSEKLGEMSLMAYCSLGL